MKKYLLFLFILSPLLIFSQNNFNCNSGKLFEQQLLNDSAFANNQQRLELETQNFVLKQQQNKTTAGTKIIPVVFHIIHTGGSENISMAQIKNQLDIMNKEYTRTMADTTLTPAPFAAVAGKLDIEFRLATKDPNGNCTNGVTRTYNTLSVCSVNNNDVKSIIYWPSNKYLNIWIVASMHYAGSVTCNGGGYAQFPGGAATTDGIVMRGDLIGSIGTSVTNSGWGNFMGRYLVHESGHWFNLRHIWGDANCGNDLVSDTPPAVTDNSGCSTFPHNPNNSCGSNANGEMFDNYMDYSQGACLNIFTQGQATRMDAALNSGTSGRNNLWSNANLIATGTDVLTTPNCPAVPEILPYTYKTICAGSSVSFTDVSYGGSISSRTWNFPGGNASSLTDSIVSVTYSTPGIYNLSLTINNANGSNNKTFNARVYVISSTASPNYTAPFTESFETASLFSDWYSVSSPGDSLWRLTSATSYTGSNCIMMKNFNAKAPTEHEIISPAYDLSNLSSVTVKFRLNFSVSDTTDTDVLKVYVSNNCGVTWTQRYFKVANGGLNTGTQLHSTSYTPAVGSGEWRQETFTIQNFMATTNVRLKFRFTSGGGNNVYVDDININGTPLNGISSIVDTEEGLLIYPNPSHDLFNLKLQLKQAAPLKASISDVCGKEVNNYNWGIVPEGENELTLNNKHLSPGIYFMTVFSGNLTLAQKKIIIE